MQDSPLTITKLNAALYAEAVPTFILPSNLYYGIQALGRDIGVYGEGNTGVYGTGDSTGVHGYVTGADDLGVYGQNTNTS